MFSLGVDLSISEQCLVFVQKVVERLKLVGEGKQFMAMYSSVVGGITTDPAAMVLPLDDHMVHRGHGVFDTAMIINGSVTLLLSS